VRNLSSSSISQYVEEYERLLEERKTTLTAVLETHVHADHISGASTLAATHSAPHYLHPDDTGALEGATSIADPAFPASEWRCCIRI
jgi:glyoxylase-like metal-dependent hydrolase (beta-lactamase superfamily II)